MKEGLMEKKPIKKETKANRQREEAWLPGEEPRRRQREGGDRAGRGGLAERFIKKQAGGGETRKAWSITKPVNYTPIIPKPLGRNPRVTCQGKRKKKSIWIQVLFLPCWVRTAVSSFLGKRTATILLPMMHCKEAVLHINQGAHQPTERVIPAAICE